MSKLYFGSIDFSKLLEQAKAGHKAFSKGSNGKIYLNLNVWVNDTKDDYDNIASIQANYKDAPKEDKFYFGNLKEGTMSSAPVTAEDIPDADDLNF